MSDYLYDMANAPIEGALENDHDSGSIERFFSSCIAINKWLQAHDPLVFPGASAEKRDHVGDATVTAGATTGAAIGGRIGAIGGPAGALLGAAVGGVIGGVAAGFGHELATEKGSSRGSSTMHKDSSGGNDRSR